MPNFKDEHIIIIAPGSHTTLAQLGLPESFTPARFRFKSRMFPAEKAGEWEPNKIRKTVKSNDEHASNGNLNGQTSMVNGEEPAYEEDPLSDEGAVWPIIAGRIKDWPCFFGLMSHIYQTLNPPFHTPILLIAQPAWTTKDHEKITQFFFEKFKTPGFAIIDNAQATCYAFGVPTACVIDVGADKADVTAITEFLVDDIGRSIAVPGCGGESMTQRLLELLGPKGFTRDMCEQLKRSPICEILQPGVPLPGTSQSKENGHIENPAAAASTGAEGSGPNQRHTAGSLGEAPRGPGPDTEVGGDDRKDDEENDGVLDVASIVAGGKMNEYLARKEKEKAEKAAAKKKNADANAAAAKPVRLKNSERERNAFLFEDNAMLDALKGSDMDGRGVAEAKAALDEGPSKRAQDSSQSLNQTEQQSAPDTAISPISPTLPRNSTLAPRRELTVGTERFLAASGNLLTNLSTVIHRTILSVPEASSRPDLWNSLIIVGNGSAVRGFKETLLATLQSRFLISPSSATIFTSELPSNLSTPIATGANTPIPQQHGHGQLGHSVHGSGVNPLLLAATTASAQAQSHLSASGHLLPPGGSAAAAHSHSSHGQTPTSIRLAKLPEYFPEWKDVGSEEAAFLGAQVAAKMMFVVDQGGAGKGYMSRTDYNEQGPSGIHDYSM